jgi:simple sugar transport system ATP-binding protein
VAENMVLDVYDRAPYSSGISLNPDVIRDTARQRVADYDVRTTSITTRVSTLSGGNQQKVIVAREVGRDVKLLLASQPTRGLDVGSIEFVHKQIIAQRDRGAGVIIVSSELDEIYALSDRIAVMYEGRIVGFAAPDVPEQELGLMMAGAEAGNGQPPAGAPGTGAPGTGTPSTESSAESPVEEAQT